MVGAGQHKLNHRAIQHYLAGFFEIDRYSVANDGLDLAKPPIRPIWVVDQRSNL